MTNEFDVENTERELQAIGHFSYPLYFYPSLPLSFSNPYYISIPLYLWHNTKTTPPPLQYMNMQDKIVAIYNREYKRQVRIRRAETNRLQMSE